jgi:hypothetical protein
LAAQFHRHRQGRLERPHCRDGNRIGDVNRGIADMRDLLPAEMTKNHNEMLHRLADRDTRLTIVEQRIKPVIKPFRTLPQPSHFAILSR